MLLESKRLAKLVLDYARARRSGAEGAAALMELFTVAGGQQPQQQPQGGGNNGNINSNTCLDVAASGPQSLSVIDYSFIDQYVHQVWGPAI